MSQEETPTLELTPNHWFPTPVWHGKISTVNLSDFKQHILNIVKSVS